MNTSWSPELVASLVQPLIEQRQIETVRLSDPPPFLRSFSLAPVTNRKIAKSITDPLMHFLYTCRHMLFTPV